MFKLSKLFKAVLNPGRALAKLGVWKTYNFGSRRSYKYWHSFFETASKNDDRLLLFVDFRVPTPDQDAGSFIAAEYLKILVQMGFHVVFWPMDANGQGAYAKRLLDQGVMIQGDGVSPAWFVKKFAKYFSVAFVSRPDGGHAFLKPLKKASRLTRVYIGVDLHFLREARQQEIALMKGLIGSSEVHEPDAELQLMRQADVSLYFSDFEVAWIAEHAPDVLVKKMPWIEPVKDLVRPVPLRKSALFLGGFSHSPNVDAIVWFFEEIFPRIKSRVPDFQMELLGSNVPEEVQRFERPGVKVVGFVAEDELESYFSRARVFVVPLRFGAGFKGKIAKSLSFGVPVVTTSIGAEGIGLQDGQTVYVADDPQVFADRIISLFEDDVQWQSMSDSATSFARQNFSTVNARKFLETIL